MSGHKPSSRAGPRAGFGFIGLGVPGVLLFAFLVTPIIALFDHVKGSQIVPVLQDPNTKAAVITSLKSTTISTFLVVVLGVPLAYILTRYAFRGRGIVSGLVYLPLVLPPVVGGILLLLVWGRDGLIGQFLEPHGVMVVGYLSGIVLAQMFVSAPFVVIAARSAFESQELEVREAAVLDGAGELRTFAFIALPLAMRAILAGASLSWMRAFGEFGATVVMAYHPYSFPVYTWVQLTSAGLAPVLPMSVLALALGIVALMVAAALERAGLLRGQFESLSRRRRSTRVQWPTGAEQVQ